MSKKHKKKRNRPRQAASKKALSGSEPVSSSEPVVESQRPLLPLTAMRFFLALWVLMFHQTYVTGMLGYTDLIRIWWLSGLVRTGYVAVSIFFTLSGFVLAYNYPLESTWSFSGVRDFMVNRFARVYPVYLLGLLLFVPYYVLDYRAGTIVVSDEVRNFLLEAGMVQSWYPFSLTSWNYPDWSVSAEMFFYFCFPFLGVLLWRVKTVRSASLLGALLWLIAIAVPLYAVLKPIVGFGDILASGDPTNRFWAQFIKFSPLFRLPDFLLGVLTARVYRLLETRKSKWLGRGYALYLPAILVATVVLMYGNDLPYPLIHNGVLSPVFCCLVLGFALGGGPLHPILSWKPLVVLGQASYAFYILQSPIERLLKSFILWWTGSDLQNWNLVFLYIALMSVISVASFYWIEEPIRKRIKRLVKRLTQKRLVAAASNLDGVAYSSAYSGEGTN